MVLFYSTNKKLMHNLLERLIAIFTEIILLTLHEFYRVRMGNAFPISRKVVRTAMDHPQPFVRKLSGLNTPV